MGLVQRIRRRPSAFECDQSTLATLVERGADLDRERLLRHFLFTAADSDAVRVAKELRDQGFDVDITPMSRGRGFVVSAEREQVVNSLTVAAARERFEAVAAGTRRGLYDGWEATVVELV